MISSDNIDKTAQALIEHHGEDGAQDYCKKRIQHHDEAKEGEAANLWRAIAKSVGILIEGTPDSK